MTPEARQHLRAVFDAHSEAIRAIREAGAFVRKAAATLLDAGTAHDEAIAGALAVNQAAIDLLNELDTGESK